MEGEARDGPDARKPARRHEGGGDDGAPGAVPPSTNCSRASEPGPKSARRPNAAPATVPTSPEPTHWSRRRGRTADALSPVAAGPDAGAADAGGLGQPVPGPDDGIIAQRDELLVPDHRAPQPHGQARPRRRPEPAARQSAQQAVAARPTSSSATRAQHVEAFASAARSHLGKAFAAGTTFGGSRAAVPEGDAVEHAASGLAQVIVTMLRRQIADGGDEPTDRVGAAYREWRGERIERLVGDSTTQAFSAGVAAARRGRQSALGRDPRERMLGLRGQCVGRCGQRGRSVPDWARLSAGAFGLSLSRCPDGRLTWASEHRHPRCLSVGSGGVDVRLPSCASPAI